MPIYSDKEKWHSEYLERVIRIIILKCDPNAPVKPFIKYLQSFDLRRDVFNLYKRITETRTDKAGRREN